MSRIDSQLATFFGSFIAMLGVLLSVYTRYVGNAKMADDEYQALCDISDTMSCSKVFTSEYGFGFGIFRHVVEEDSLFNISNSVFGIIFYVLHFLGILMKHKVFNVVLFWLAVLSQFASLYLAYILAYILNDFCVVCVSTYTINLVLLVFNFLRMRSSNVSHSKLRKKSELKKAKKIM